jgi:hypothetical protein
MVNQLPITCTILRKIVQIATHQKRQISRIFLLLLWQRISLRMISAKGIFFAKIMQVRPIVEAVIDCCLPAIKPV